MTFVTRWRRESTLPDEPPAGQGPWARTQRSLRPLGRLQRCRHKRAASLEDAYRHTSGTDIASWFSDATDVADVERLLDRAVLAGLALGLIAVLVRRVLLEILRPVSRQLPRR